jgi:hypothetical protein
VKHEEAIFKAPHIRSLVRKYRGASVPRTKTTFFWGKKRTNRGYVGDCLPTNRKGFGLLRLGRSSLECVEHELARLCTAWVHQAQCEEENAYEYRGASFARHVQRSNCRTRGAGSGVAGAQIKSDTGVLGV